MVYPFEVGGVCVSRGFRIRGSIVRTAAVPTPPSTTIPIPPTCPYLPKFTVERKTRACVCVCVYSACEGGCFSTPFLFLLPTPTVLPLQTGLGTRISDLGA